MRKTFWPRWDEVTGEWRRLHIEELCAVYSSSYFILVIKSGNEMASTGEERTRFWLGTRGKETTWKT
jgi:hypothetical protein